MREISRNLGKSWEPRKESSVGGQVSPPLRTTGASERMSVMIPKMLKRGLAVNKIGGFKRYEANKKHRVFHKIGVWVFLLGLSLLFAQCSGSNEPKRARTAKERIKRDLGGPELGNIGDKRHSVINPSRQNAEATGIGCGPSRADALKSALRVALFNLREVTGNARYQVEYQVIDEKPGVEEYCLEMAAKARP